jgi:glycosyltransferase involved in cell wall biosynthesis
MSTQLSSTRIDLVRWHRPVAHDGARELWPCGEIIDLDPAWRSANARLARWAQESTAEYGLLWSGSGPLPSPETLSMLVASELDVAHAGLLQGLDKATPDLEMVVLDWSMINAPATSPSSSWRVGLDTCLVRRSVWSKLGGLDDAYQTSVAAGLDWGRRCLKFGVLVEHRPELVAGRSHPLPASAVDPCDLYIYLLRHHGLKWARYVAVRRGLRSGLEERRLLNRARAHVAAVPAPEVRHAWRPLPSSVDSQVRSADVSVIIPTLGRYPYLPDALESLRRQTVRPREVIIVDQNPPEAREPATYEGYDELNLRVVWQDERGQSLARNTALAQVTSTYVFMFDDDSIAHDDLIEQHLRVVLGGRFDVSTGVAFPPPPTTYQLPKAFVQPRVAQTFDSGNSLVRTSLVYEMGGFDRNYDLGPGTDMDFGTRLYLAGKRIAHTPSAVRIHFKAPTGGLRVHGAHKYNSDAALLGPFPPPTQSYYATRYLDGKQRFERTLLQFATSKIGPEARKGDPRAVVRLALTSVLLPIKWWRSNRRARALLDKGVRTDRFPTTRAPT